MKIIRVSALWCPGCLVMNKVWNEIEKEYPNIEMIKYDYDFDDEEVNKFDVGKILPVAIFMDDDNQELTRLNGEKSVREIEEVISNYE